MKRLCQIATIFAPLVILPSALAIEVAHKEIAARTELYQIQTLTLSDQQFLKGGVGGKPVTISGQLRIAQGPAVCRLSCSSTGQVGTPQTSMFGREISMRLAYRHSLLMLSPGAALQR